MAGTFIWMLGAPGKRTLSALSNTTKGWDLRHQLTAFTPALARRSDQNLNLIFGVGTAHCAVTEKTVYHHRKHQTMVHIDHWSIEQADMVTFNDETQLCQASRI
jgi:hypothetical protein